MTESEMENGKWTGKKSRKKHVICQRDEVYVEKGKQIYWFIYSLQLSHSRHGEAYVQQTEAPFGAVKL